MADEQKWYYRLTDNITCESFRACVNLPIKEEKFCEFLGLEGYAAKQISKEEYEEESEDVE